MSSPDYPTLTVPGYDLYQAAVIATFVVDALARHRHAAQRADQAGRRTAARDVHAGRLALSRVVDEPGLADGPLPRPLDVGTFTAAHALLDQQDSRRVQVVSLAPIGRQAWAVVGRIPEIGAVGAEVSHPHLAESLRRHLLDAPIAELTGWSVTAHPVDLGTEPRTTGDVAAAVASLDPINEKHRVLATALRGVSDELGRVITKQFPPRPAPAKPAAQPVRKPPAPATGLSVAAEALGTSRPTTAAAGRVSTPSAEPAATRPAPRPPLKPAQQSGRGV